MTAPAFFATPPRATGLPAHPAWCQRTHTPDYPAHAAQVDELILDKPTCSSIAVNVAKYDADPAKVELVRHGAKGTAPTSLALQEARRLSGLLAMAVRMASGTDADPENPVVSDVATSLRVLGAVTRRDAEALLSRCVVELTDRERLAVLATFPEGGAR